MKKLAFLLALVVGASSVFAADAANDVLINQRNSANDDNVQRNVTAVANSIFVFNSSLEPAATAAPILASVQANASGGLLLKNFSGTTVMTIGPGSGTGVAFNASGLTSVNSVTAASSTDLTLSGGSSGASLVLGQGAAGVGSLSRRLAVTAVDAAPPSSGTTVVGGLRLVSSNNVALDLGINGSASPFPGWIQVSDATNQATHYPLVLQGTGSNVLVGTTTNPSSLDGGLVLNGSGAGATASSTTTGTLRVTGGAGFTGAGYFGGLVNAASLATAQTPSASVATASTHKVAIVLNGTTYYILLTNVP